MASPAKLALIGWPVAHSLSPRLHRHWMKKYGIDGEYEALAVPPAALKDTAQSLAAQGYRGFNVTVPHKEAIVPVLAVLDNAASVIGAVNTVVIESSGRLKGTNTDVYGFRESLKAAGIPAARRKAVVLGAGGAARAVVKALLDDGFERIVIVNRTQQKADVLVTTFSAKAVTRLAWESRSSALKDADLLVNATNLGMTGNAPLLIDLALLPKSSPVADIVYAPLETPLLADAKRRGHPVIDGLPMLMHQAAAAFEAWFDIKPNLDGETREALLA